MATRPLSVTPRFTKETKSAPGPAESEHPLEFGSLVSRLLDEFDAADFRSAERVLEVMRRQGRTVAGYPRVRPKDCDRVIRAARAAFDANRPLFVTGDKASVERFDQILEAFAATDLKFYPRELMNARALQAEARLILNDPKGALALIGDYAERPYKIDGDQGDFIRLMRLDCQARVAAAEVEGLGRKAIARALTVCRQFPKSLRAAAEGLSEFFGVDAGVRARDGVLLWSLHRLAGTTTRLRMYSGSKLSRIMRKPLAWLGLRLVSAQLFLMRYGDLRFARADKSLKRDIVVSRAMGGIGDLFMMTPGLRALSRRHSTRVKLVIERKYFDIFRNNPHVETIDIDGPPLDVARARAWFNLTVCPAGRYEHARRPFIKKGRVELFARAMRVSRLGLHRHGWNVDYTLDDDQVAFRDAFLREAGLGARPIVGVQPYARDSYKNHSDIARLIDALGAEYDLVVFHHIGSGLPSGPGIASTDGLPLWQSIALVSALRAMVCVDSAFLHAAAAFDVPVVAMFGPTDGRLFTRHHRNAHVIAMNERFPCAPCWRNEDLPCALTGQFGPSPCVAAIKIEPLLAAVAAALREDRARVA